MVRGPIGSSQSDRHGHARKGSTHDTNTLESTIKKIVKVSSLVASIFNAMGLIKAKAISSGFNLLFDL